MRILKFFSNPKESEKERKSYLKDRANNNKIINCYAVNSYVHIYIHTDTCVYMEHRRMKESNIHSECQIELKKEEPQHFAFKSKK